MPNRPETTLFPKLSAAEWATFAALSAGLAVTNIYTTLLTGWGDGGSIIAVVASVLILNVIARGRINIMSLNLGQTMASAGGSAGFAVCSYAAVKMVKPDFEAATGTMIIAFAAMGMLGTIVGASVRKQMVRYFFPSGTACAVIQRTVTSTDAAAARRPVTLLKYGGGTAMLATIPTKIAAAKGGEAIIGSIPFSAKLGIGLSLEPLLYGIGLVVGPRIGIGMMLGALLAPFLIRPTLAEHGIPAAQHSDWVRWMAIAVLTLPTFATIFYAYLFRSPPIIPEGFAPGVTAYERPKQYMPALIGIGIVSAIVTAVTVNMLFGVPIWVSFATILVAWPMCVMNGRVTGETDINPVRLVAIVVLTVFFTIISEGAVALLGMAIIGGALAGMAVDMMQDLRTGFLIDADPHHQIAVEFVGAVIGAIVAVPFILYLDRTIGFGEGKALVAPGGQIWAAMAKAYAGGAGFTPALWWSVGIVSAVFSGLAYFGVWPKTAPYVPSLFGIGIGLLLPFDMCAAIFVGGMLKYAALALYPRMRPAQPRALAQAAAADDTMLIGSSVFAASAITSVLVVIANAFGLVHLPGH